MEELKKPVHPKYLFIITTIIFLLVMYYLLYNIIGIDGCLIFTFIWTFIYYLLYRFIVIPEYNDKLRHYEEKKKYQITLEKEREDRRLQKLNDDIEVERIINLNLDINNYLKNDINVRLIELLEDGYYGESESIEYYIDKTGESLEKSKEYVIYLKHNIPSVLKNWDVIEEKRLIELNKLQTNIISELDKDNNGQIDLIDGESFVKILNKNQISILEVDKNYIQKFVKISIYLKTKKNNTQKIFESISETKDDEELIELVNLLKNQIHTYELLVFHSINMVTSLVDSDLITFYEIYECFDKLGVFNSNWENEVSDKLTDIKFGIKDLMYSIYQMENKIVNSIDNLTYTTQESFMDLTNSVEKQLSSIDSSIKFNNLLTGIQTYQMYKINQNTKRIGYSYGF